MIYSKSLAQVAYESMRVYQRHLAKLRFEYGHNAKSAPIQVVLMHIKNHRGMWRAATDGSE